MNNFKNLELLGAAVSFSISIIMLVVTLYTKGKIRLASIIATVLFLIAAIAFSVAYAKSVKNE